MIAIHIDSERKYLEVAAAARAAGDEFELVRSRDGVVSSAEKYWCANKELAKQYKSIKIDAYDPDLPKSKKRVDAKSTEPEGKGDDAES